MHGPAHPSRVPWRAAGRFDSGEMMASDLAVTASRDGCWPGAIAAAQDASCLTHCYGSSAHDRSQNTATFVFSHSLLTHSWCHDVFDRRCAAAFWARLAAGGSLANHGHRRNICLVTGTSILRPCLKLSLGATLARFLLRAFALGWTWAGRRWT